MLQHGMEKSSRLRNEAAKAVRDESNEEKNDEIEIFILQVEKGVHEIEIKERRKNILG